MNIVANAIAQSLTDIEPFSRLILKRPLRPYQLDPARAAVLSVLRRDGDQYVWRFPRQSGKNETVAHVHAYLLFLYQRVKGASIVHTAPTYDPQAHNAQRRVLEITAGSPFFSKIKANGNRLILGNCSITFLSGMERDKPNVGSTASLLLSKDECQDLDQAYIEQAFDPMTADMNAPHIHTGTARHDGTYLARKRQELEQKEKQDGKKRVFIINWRDVAAVNPAYGLNVQQVISRKGAMHPSVLTEYENVETAQTGRLFDERRISLIFNTQAKRLFAPKPNTTYVATIDIGGTDLVGAGLASAHEHDMTVLTIHQVDFAPLPSEPSPTFASLATFAVNPSGLNHFTTVEHFTLQGDNVLDDTHARKKLFAILDMWNPARIITDSTGIGLGFSGTLISRYRQRVIPFTFTSSSKTELLNEWLALIETGRYHHYAGHFPCIRNGSCDPDCARFRRQLEKCEHEEFSNHIEWSIPAHITWRNPVTLQDEHLHDDHLMSTALVAVLADADLAPREASSTPAAKRDSNTTVDRTRIVTQ